MARRDQKQLPQAPAHLGEQLAPGAVPAVVHGHQGDPRRGGQDGGHPGITAQPPDVVHHGSAGGDRGPGDLGLARVHRDRHRQPPGQGLQQRHHPAQLRGGVHRIGAGPGGLTADVDEVGTLRHQPLGEGHRRGEVAGETVAREGVGCRVDHPHDQGPGPEPERAVSAAERVSRPAAGQRRRQRPAEIVEGRPLSDQACGHSGEGCGRAGQHGPPSIGSGDHPDPARPGGALQPRHLIGGQALEGDRVVSGGDGQGGVDAELQDGAAERFGRARHERADVVAEGRLRGRDRAAHPAARSASSTASMGGWSPALPLR